MTFKGKTEVLGKGDEGKRASEVAEHTGLGKSVLTEGTVNADHLTRAGFTGVWSGLLHKTPCTRHTPS